MAASVSVAAILNVTGAVPVVAATPVIGVHLYVAMFLATIANLSDAQGSWIASLLLGLVQGNQDGV